ncbi:OB-fold domain-containing protein [Granulicoccus phenolivorans]|uniref:OB-fold domain-containing protein n=1 Tax=Granulicoccus phenolivorans TaxID=266854 RepID=UPI0004276194|nr:OB-fold domain-containing protein [Granulicoccus phenolivorans]
MTNPRGARGGITGWGSYLPAYRLDRAAIAGGAGRGARVVASYDEDPTTMAVAALREMAAPGPDQFLLASCRPAYVDKTNATAVHAAMGWDPHCLSVDLGANQRSAAAALLAGHRTGGTVALADVTWGRPGSTDEAHGGDGAAVFSFGTEDVLAVVEATISLTEEFTDRWAVPGEYAQQWEERFGVGRYQDLIRRATAQLGAETPDRVVFASANPTLGRRGPGITGRLGTHLSPIGAAGTAGLGLALADALDQAGPGETLLVLSAADGCDALLLRTTDLIATHRRPLAVAAQLAAGRPVSYYWYLSWRGVIQPEPPRRPEPDRVSSPSAGRSVAWKFGLQGSRCEACGMLHLPPERVCKNCGAIDRMRPESVADRQGTVATFTVDRLAYSPSPPLIEAVVDLVDGGRLLVELADVAPEEIHVGLTVEFTFRKLFSTGSIHNYFWKVRPLR